MSLREAYGEVFRSGVPRWLMAFADDPARAIDDLLLGRFHHGRLQASEPEDLLLGWLRQLADYEDFTTGLDAAARSWIEQRWGQMLPSPAGHLLPHAWRRLGAIVSATDELSATARALRERFDDSREFLGPLSSSPSHDPLGSYYRAIAEHQHDRRLASHWWALAMLADGTPFFHGLYGVIGIARLPGRGDHDDGGFRDDVVHAVVQVAKGLSQRSERSLITTPAADLELRAVAGWALAAFPFPDRWRKALAPGWEALPERIRRGLQAVIPGLDGRRLAKPPARSPSRDWSEDTRRLIAKAKRGTASTAELERFLAQARARAEQTGDSTPLNRALCRFASIRTVDAGVAVGWAAEARQWEPWNAYSWTTLTRALQRANRLDDALTAAWKTVERFPENVVARAGLAEVLKVADRLVEAEAVYRDTVERFPEDVVARNGLAEVRRLLEGGSTRVSTLSSGTLLVAREPLAAYASAAVPRSSPVDSRSARVMRREARRAEDSAGATDSGPARLRERAKQLLDTRLAEHPHDTRALAELGLLLADTKQLDEARARLGAEAELRKGDPLLWSSLARAVREGARAHGVRLDEATIEQVLAAPEHLRHLDRIYEPLAYLQEGRAYLALTDGAARLEGAAHAFDGLRRWTARPSNPSSFEHWVGEQVRCYAFEGQDLDTEITSPNVEEIASTIDRNARRVDALEEDFVHRFA
ncbi:MAG: hypothetical protein AB1Z98_21965 [Nannocystaceae bacterium]